MKKQGTGLVTIDGISFTDTAIIRVASNLRGQSTLGINGTTGRVHTSQLLSYKEQFNR